MNKEFLMNVMWHAKYLQKPHTTSYVNEHFFDLCNLKGNDKRDQTTQRIAELKSKGEKVLLPITITLADDTQLCTAKIAQTGRGMLKRTRQMKSSFTIPEESIYKREKPYKVCTSVWHVTGRSSYYYGDVAINFFKDSKPKPTHDLMIFKTDDWEMVDVYVFRGMDVPNDEANLDDIVAFLDTFDA